MCRFCDDTPRMSTREVAEFINGFDTGDSQEGRFVKRRPLPDDDPWYEALLSSVEEADRRRAEQRERDTALLTKTCERCGDATEDNDGWDMVLCRACRYLTGQWE